MRRLQRIGAAGGGKTYATLIEPLRYCGNGEFGAVFFRRESTQITNEGGLWDTAASPYPLTGARPVNKITRSEPLQRNGRPRTWTSLRGPLDRRLHRVDEGVRRSAEASGGGAL
jgi:hypothetical protein